MQSVILPSLQPTQFEPLTETVSEYLLPIVNKPIAEHLVEHLARHGVRRVLMVKRHLPYETEQYFKNGERWGVEIAYFLEKEFDSIFVPLNRIRSRIEEDFICFAGNVFTDMNVTRFIKAHQDSGADLSFSVPAEGKEIVVQPGEDIFNEGYPFIMSPGTLNRLCEDFKQGPTDFPASSLMKDDLQIHFFRNDRPIQKINNLDDLWNANRDAISGKYPDVLIPGKEIKKGVWVGENPMIHADARLNPPVLIGDNCALSSKVEVGEGACLGSDIIVGQGASIKNSIILDKTHLGEQIDVANSIVKQNLWIRLDRKSHLYLTDEFLLGKTSGNLFPEWKKRARDMIAAALALIVLSPVLLAGLLAHLFSGPRGFLSKELGVKNKSDEPFQTEDNFQRVSIYVFKCENPLMRKLPGLCNVIRGDVGLVGSTLPKPEHIKELTTDWEKQWLASDPGLFHPWEVRAEEVPTREEKTVVESAYVAERTFMKDIAVVLKVISQSLRGPWK